jgi:hypothetical protein
MIAIFRRVGKGAWHNADAADGLRGRRAHASVSRHGAPVRLSEATARSQRLNVWRSWTRGHGAHSTAKTGVNALLLRAFAHPTGESDCQ